MSEAALHLALAAFVVAFPAWSALTWPRYLAEVRAGRPGVRRRALVDVCVAQWSLVVLIGLAWSAAGRPWSALRVGAPGASAWLALACCAAVAGLALWHVRSIRAMPDAARESVLAQLGDAAHVLPHDRSELRWFRAVALTAGCCEEFVYRGVLPLVLAAWLPAGLVVPVATLAFGLAHLYQGVRGVVKVTCVGAVMATLAWLCDSLWPAIALHALMDLHGGEVGHAVLCAAPAGHAPSSADSMADQPSSAQPR